MQINDVSKGLVHVQNNYQNDFIFQMFFFLIKCAPFFLKIENDLNIDDYKKKTFEIGKLHF
jgi:hypothetical protein